MNNMKQVIKLNGEISKEEVLENIKANNGVCYLQLHCDWESANTEYLNELLVEDVENGMYLCDVSYKPIDLDTEDGTITFEVCVADTTDYIKYYEEDN